MSRGRAGAVFASYVVVFTALMAPWLPQIAQGVPTGAFAPDEFLIVWVLAWVAHALRWCPSRLFSAPMNYPSPLQLTASEHFLSSQLLFSPVLWATGNAVLATNVCVIASYPVAALAMQRLVVALGCDGAAAWVAGLVFALGPLRVPARPHALQYLNLYLPLTALVLLRLRDGPTVVRAALFALVLGAGFLSSYYAAVLVALVAGLWGIAEALRREPRRGRFVGLSLVALAASASLLAAVSRPYAAQAASRERSAMYFRAQVDQLSRATFSKNLDDITSSAVLAQSFPGFGPGPWSTLFFPPLPLALACVGTIGLASRCSRMRRAALLGVAFTLSGWTLMLGPGMTVAGHRVPLPFAVVQASPLAFFRASERFAVLAGFGTALLAGVGLGIVARRLPQGLARVAPSALAAIAVVLTSGRSLGRNSLLHVRAAVEDAAVYDRLGDLVRRMGDGPLLEVPTSAWCEACIGATRHWLPSISNYTGYVPDQGPTVDQALRLLPDGEMVADLVDMTHLRWLLVRPPSDWGGAAPRLRFLTALESQHLAAPALTLDGGWALLRILRAPRHPQWFTAIAAGTRPGFTVLGTPLRPLTVGASLGRLSIDSAAATAQAGAPLQVRLGVTNEGDAPWPAVAPLGPPIPYVVRLRAHWRARGAAPGSDVPAVTFPLRRDLPPAETLHQQIAPPAPATPGSYDLEVSLEQLDVGRLDE